MVVNFRAITFSREDVERAMERFDRERRDGFSHWKRYSVKHNGKHYPPKELLRLLGANVENLSGGEPANRSFRKLGFEIGTSLKEGESFRNAGSSDPTPRLSSLEAANRLPVFVHPDDKLRKAVSLMLQHDYSQLPVMQTTRSVKGIVSWKSIGEQSHVHNRHCRFVRDCMDTNVQILKHADLLWKAIAIIAENDVILVENQAHEICGLVTTYDIATQYHALAEPFLLLREIENNVRRLISRAGYPLSVLQSARDPRDTKREVRSVSDLAFGEYIRLLQEPDNWKSIGFNLSRGTFLTDLHTINNIRNEVMHFRPGGLKADQLANLHRVAKMLRNLQLWSSATPRKRTGSANGGARWDIQSVIAELRKKSDVVAEVAQKLIEWSKSNLSDINWGKGTNKGSFCPLLKYRAKHPFIPFRVLTDGNVEIPFLRMVKYRHVPFHEDVKRLELLHRLNTIPGVDVPDDGIHRRPSFPMTMLVDPPAYEAFINTIDWAVDTVRSGALKTQD